MSKVRYARIWADSLKVGDVFGREVLKVGREVKEDTCTSRTYTAWYEVTDIRELAKPLHEDSRYEVLATRSDGEHSAFISSYIHETFAADDVLIIDRWK